MGVKDPGRAYTEYSLLQQLLQKNHYWLKLRTPIMIGLDYQI